MAGVGVVTLGNMVVVALKEGSKVTSQIDLILSSQLESNQNPMYQNAL